MLAWEARGQPQTVSGYHTKGVPNHGKNNCEAPVTTERVNAGSARLSRLGFRVSDTTVFRACRRRSVRSAGHQLGRHTFFVFIRFVSAPAGGEEVFEVPVVNLVQKETVVEETYTETEEVYTRAPPRRQLARKSSRLHL